MCLAIPGKIVEVYDTGDLRMGKIDFGGAKRDVCLAYVPEAGVGDYAVVHVGFAISVLSEEEANATLAMLREMMDLEEEIGPEAGIAVYTGQAATEPSHEAAEPGQAATGTAQAAPEPEQAATEPAQAAATNGPVGMEPGRAPAAPEGADAE
jgi:hydrogenase expression/formation protein HypC